MLARSLGLSVVVEGLETPGLIEAAALLGADAGQGYAIARPMPPDAVPGWAAGFALGLDPARPRTALGALASHLAWELRLAAVRPSAPLWRQAASDACPLSEFIDVFAGGSGEIAQAHAVVHENAVAERGSAEHRRAWTRLVALLRAAAPS